MKIVGKEGYLLLPDGTLGVFYGGAMLFTGHKQLDYLSDPRGLKRRKKRKDR